MKRVLALLMGLSWMGFAGAATLVFQMNAEIGMDTYKVPGFSVKETPQFIYFSVPTQQLRAWHQKYLGSKFTQARQQQFNQDVKHNSYPPGLKHDFYTLSYRGVNYTSCAPTVNSKVFVIECIRPR